jgi:hypothetical protein
LIAENQSRLVSETPTLYPIPENGNPAKNQRAVRPLRLPPVTNLRLLDNPPTRAGPNYTVDVAWLDRFSRNFEEGVRSQAELTRRDIGIVAIRENIDSREGSAAAKFFRRSMLAQGPTRWTRPVSGSSWGWHGPERRESG